MASGDRIEVATAASVETVQQNITTVDQKITATDTGLNDRVNTSESAISALDTDVAALKTTVGDENSGLVKTTTDLYGDIHTAGTGLDDRVTDLEQSSGGGGDATYVGDVKSSLISTNHNGWFAFNGQPLSALTPEQVSNANQLGFSGTLPNLAGYTLAGTLNVMELGNSGGSSTILRSDLPNTDITVSGTTDINDKSHTHTTAAYDITSSSDQTGMISGMETDDIAFLKKYKTGSGEEDVRIDYGDVGGMVGVVSDELNFATVNQDATHSHTVTVPEKTSGTNSSNHKHGYSSTFNLNNNVTQTEFIPKHMQVMYFVYLGVN